MTVFYGIPTPQQDVQGPIPASMLGRQAAFGGQASEQTKPAEAVPKGSFADCASMFQQK